VTYSESTRPIFDGATVYNATHGNTVAILCVPSVRLSDACILARRNNRVSISQHLGCCISGAGVAKLSKLAMASLGAAFNGNRLHR